jgi:hypothetical protein
MLMDCARLKHWDCPAAFDELFQFKRDYKDWIALKDEPRENIGVHAGAGECGITIERSAAASARGGRTGDKQVIRAGWNAMEPEAATGLGLGNNGGDSRLIYGGERQPEASPSILSGRKFHLTAHRVEGGREDGEIDIAELLAARDCERLRICARRIKQNARADACGRRGAAGGANGKGGCAVRESDEVLTGRQVVEAIPAALVDRGKSSGSELGTQRPTRSGFGHRQNLSAPDGLAAAVRYMSGYDSAANQPHHQRRGIACCQLNVQPGRNVIGLGDFYAVLTFREFRSMKAPFTIRFQIGGEAADADFVHAD